MAAALSAARLNRATLARQLLLARQPIAATEAVRRVVAVQAQEPASPYLGLWNRVADFDPADLDGAFRDGAVVKAPLLRITLHAVTSEDHPWFQRAMLGNLRAARLNDRRFAETGLTKADANALLPHLVAFTSSAARTKHEILGFLGEHLGGPPHPNVWWALRTFAPLVHAPTGGPWSFDRSPTYAAAPAGATEVEEAEQQEGLRRLARRYLQGFGPASAADLAQFTMQARSVTRRTLASLEDELVTLVGPDGTVLHDVPDGELPPDGLPAPARLLPMWDSTLLAYADRSRIIPDDVRPLVIRRNGDVLPTLLVDGHVVGVWRPRAGAIEATAFRPLRTADWRALAAEAEALLALLAPRDPEVYGRFSHWWPKLPPAEVRLLP